MHISYSYFLSERSKVATIEPAGQAGSTTVVVHAHDATLLSLPEKSTLDRNVYSVLSGTSFLIVGYSHLLMVEKTTS